MSFSSLSNDLTGQIPGLSPFLADSFVNRAWREIRDSRLWSFLQEDGAVVCPTQITAGTVAIVQFTTTVTCDEVASAALLAQNASVPTLTAMQIRFGGSANNAAFAGQLYNITGVNDSVPTAVVLTLNRMVVQPSNATSGYQCYRCYVTPPVDDFLAWQSVVDMTNGWRFKQDYTSTYFDTRDPQRQAQGLGYYLGAYKGNDETQPGPRYEIWPHPTSGQTLYVRYRRQGEDFINAADVQPILIPDELILDRAYGWHAYPWAAANVSLQPGLRGVGWINLQLTRKQAYVEALVRAKRNDNEQQLQDVWSRGHGLRAGRGGFKGMYEFPIDSNFIQSHLVSF